MMDVLMPNRDFSASMISCGSVFDFTVRKIASGTLFKIAARNAFLSVAFVHSWGSLREIVPNAAAHK